jgi:hypothetical protein
VEGIPGRCRPAPGPIRLARRRAGTPTARNSTATGCGSGSRRASSQSSSIRPACCPNAQETVRGSPRPNPPLLSETEGEERRTASARRRATSDLHHHCVTTNALDRAGAGRGDVSQSRALRRNAARWSWGSGGASAAASLPSTRVCVCSVSQVGRQSS